jgi:hypothetical protein
MLQKMIVGFLMLTVVGAAGVGIYDSSRSSSAADANPLLASSDPVVVPVEQAAPQIELAATPTVEPAADTVTQTQQQPVQQQSQQAVDMVGDPWNAQGSIVAFDTAGMTLAVDGAQLYVELGPPHYWQAQGVTLAVGEVVTVDGFYNGDQYHAATVTKADGSQLVVRTAEGLPLWSGGASSDQTGTNGQGGNAGQQSGQGNNGQGNSGQSNSDQGNSGQGGNGQGGNGQGGNGNTAGLGQTQVAPEDWITLDATVVSQDVNGLTVQTQAGEVLTFQLGQARFVDGQAVTFAAGDEIEIRGFWQGETFRPGEIVKLATGERLMLLDPNGRPLWGGPGRSGSNSGSSGQGNSGQSGSGQGNSGQGGNGQGGGNGKGYRGGR